MFKIKAEKDFQTGLIYVGLGALFMWFGQDYRMGTGARMGPGYFPIVLSGILIVLGLISIGRSFLVEGEKVGAIAWKPMGLTMAACIAFAVLLKPLGLIFSLAALCLISFRASQFFKIDRVAVIGLLGLIVFCVLVFVKGLGVPLPILGTLFEPYVPQWLIR